MPTLIPFPPELLLLPHAAPTTATTASSAQTLSPLRIPPPLLPSLIHGHDETTEGPGYDPPPWSCPGGTYSGGCGHTWSSCGCRSKAVARREQRGYHTRRHGPDRGRPPPGQTPLDPTAGREHTAVGVQDDRQAPDDRPGARGGARAPHGRRHRADPP